jgi:polysaccharide biosynthesis protein PslH
MKGKDIIFISPQRIFNPTSGVESRINNLVKIFSKDNNLTIFAPKQSKTKKYKNIFFLDYSNKYRKLFDTRIINKTKPLIKNQNIDLIFGTTLWAGINSLILSLIIKKPYYFDDHNLEFLRYKRTKSPIWPIIFILEYLIIKFSKKTICVSEKDKSFMIKYFKVKPKKIIVIENPVDKSIFFSNKRIAPKIKKGLGIKNNQKMILFFGQLNYIPNIEALKIIKKEILPKLDKIDKNYKLVICGKGNGNGLLKNFKHKNVIFKGFVQKIQDYINASDVVIAPLISGSGTRIKILEALECKTKVVSTSIGAEGIKRNRLLEVEDDWNKFVKKL